MKRLFCKGQCGTPTCTWSTEEDAEAQLMMELHVVVMLEAKML